MIAPATSASPAYATASAASPARIGREAIRALYTEIALYPKPGLVSPMDSGAHGDMDFRTFMRSLFALRNYFPKLATAGAADAEFTALQQMGVVAERQMLAATQGVNTHRGAIFSLGLLAAAAGRLCGRGRSVRGDALGLAVHRAWGREIAASGAGADGSHGARAVRRHGVRGARQEAAEGFPILFTIALPALHRALSTTDDTDAALVETLFVLIARLDDTNLLHRGGIEGLAFARRKANAFLDAGSVHREGWRRNAVDVHAAFVARRLSPGGAADMLAATWFVHRVQSLCE